MNPHKLKRKEKKRQNVKAVRAVWIISTVGGGGAGGAGWAGASGGGGGGGRGHLKRLSAKLVSVNMRHCRSLQCKKKKKLPVSGFAEILRQSTPPNQQQSTLREEFGYTHTHPVSLLT